MNVPFIHGGAHTLYKFTYSKHANTAHKQVTLLAYMQPNTQIFHKEANRNIVCTHGFL